MSACGRGLGLRPTSICAVVSHGREMRDVSSASTPVMTFMKVIYQRLIRSDDAQKTAHAHSIAASKPQRLFRSNRSITQILSTHNRLSYIRPLGASDAYFGINSGVTSGAPTVLPYGCGTALVQAQTRRLANIRKVEQLGTLQRRVVIVPLQAQRFPADLPRQRHVFAAPCNLCVSCLSGSAST